MNRGERRAIHKLTGQELEDERTKAMQKGIQGTLNIVYEVMNEEFGFGEKRLDRLESNILKKLGGEDEE